MIKVNEEPIAVIKELKRALENHDWYYAMSDDHGAYKRGEAQRGRINDLMKQASNQGFTIIAATLFDQHKPKYI